MRNSLNFNKTLPYLTALTPMSHFLRMALQIICSFRCLTYFLMSGSTIMQSQISLGMISKIKTSHTSELQ